MLLHQPQCQRQRPHLEIRVQLRLPSRLPDVYHRPRQRPAAQDVVYHLPVRLHQDRVAQVRVLLLRVVDRPRRLNHVRPHLHRGLSDLHAQLLQPRLVLELRLPLQLLQLVAQVVRLQDAHEPTPSAA